MTTITVTRAGAATKRTATAIEDVAANTARLEPVTTCDYALPAEVRAGEPCAISPDGEFYLEARSSRYLYRVGKADSGVLVVDIVTEGGEMEAFYEAEAGVGILGAAILDNGDWILNLGCYGAFNEGHDRGQLYRRRGGVGPWVKIASQDDGPFAPWCPYHLDNVIYAGDYNTQNAGYHVGWYVYRIDCAGDEALVDLIYSRPDPAVSLIHVHSCCVDPTDLDTVLAIFGANLGNDGKVVALSKPEGWVHGEGEWTPTDLLWGSAGNIFDIRAHGALMYVLDEGGDVFEYDPATGDLREVFSSYLNRYADVETAYAGCACGDLYWLDDQRAILAMFAYSIAAPRAQGLYATADAGRTWAPIVRRPDLYGYRRIRGMFDGKLLIRALDAGSNSHTQTLDVPTITLTEALRVGRGWTNRMVDPTPGDYFGHLTEGDSDGNMSNYMNWIDGVNLIYVCPGTGPQPLVALMVLMAAGGNGNIRLAVYSLAGALLYQGAAEVATGGAAGLFGHTTFVDAAGTPVANPTLDGGVGYILAMTGDGANLVARKNGTTSGWCKYKGTDYTGGFPATLPASTNSSSWLCMGAAVSPAIGLVTGVSDFELADGLTATLGGWCKTWQKEGDGTVTAVVGGEHGSSAMQLDHLAASGYRVRAYSRPFLNLSGLTLAEGERLTVRFRAKAAAGFPGDYRLECLVLASAGTLTGKYFVTTMRLGTTWRDFSVYYVGGAGGATISMVRIDVKQFLEDSAKRKPATALVDCIEAIISADTYYDPGDWQPGGTARGDEHADVPFIPASGAWHVAFNWRPGFRSGNTSADTPILSVVGEDGDWIDLKWVAATGFLNVTDDQARSKTSTAEGTPAFREWDVIRFVLTSDGTNTWLYWLHPSETPLLGPITESSGLHSLNAGSQGVKLSGEASYVRLGASHDASAHGLGQFSNVKASPGYRTFAQTSHLINETPTEAVVAPAGRVDVSEDWTLPAIDVDLGNVALVAAADVTIDGAAALSVVSQGADVFTDGENVITLKDLAVTGDAVLRAWGGCTLSGTVSGVQNLPGPPDEY